MAAKAFTGAADVGSATPISMTANNPHPVDVYNVANTGTAAATVYVLYTGAAGYVQLEGEIPAGVGKIIDGLRDVQALKIVGVGAEGVVTA